MGSYESRIFKLDNPPKEISKIKFVIRRTENGNILSIKSLKIHKYESFKELPLKKLKKIRKTLKGKIKRYEKFFNKYIFYRIYEKAKNSQS